MLSSKMSQSIIPEQVSKQSNTIKQFTDVSSECKNFFPKRLQSIQEYIELLQKRQVDIRKEEIVWDNNFITNQLKAAIFINYHLIKNYREQEIHIQKLTQRINQKQSQPKNAQNQSQSKFKENKHEESNKITPIKRSQAKSAFGAQKQILSAKHQKQCDEYKKAVLQLEQHLKNNKQQNEYLRVQLLTVNDKIIHLNNIIELMKLQKQQLGQERQTMQAKIRQYQVKIQTGFHQNLKHFNCSPIIKDNDTNEPEEEEISFSHQYFFQSNVETKLLRKQIEELQSQIRLKIEENQIITIKMQSLSQTIAKMDAIIHQQSANKLNIQNIIVEYKQIKDQVSCRLNQIEDYRKIVEEIKSQSKINKQPIQKQPSEDQECKQKLLKGQIANQKCDNCTSLQQNNHKINIQVQDLRGKLNSFLNFQLSQRKQWDEFLEKMKA